MAEFSKIEPSEQDSHSFFYTTVLEQEIQNYANISCFLKIIRQLKKGKE
jgi:hypothetical protein